MEIFAGTSEAHNALQINFDYGEGNEGRRFSECLQGTTAYLSTKLEGGGDVKTLIRNGKVFDQAWLETVGPNLAATKAILQTEYVTRENRVEKLRINLSTSYGLVLGQYKDYLQSRLEGQEKWEKTPNE